MTQTKILRPDDFLIRQLFDRANKLKKVAISKCQILPKKERSPGVIQVMKGTVASRRTLFHRVH